ncbi:hypothetical protein GGQ83_001998 [Roseococcus suduntuyensis]|uniref:Transposase for insertion sequence element IS21-like C-terminal domain-containing protein n=1 Tax=Roseococcus suduntuyensis TaxID=455361 RepID=A0A840ABN0_9PROT|nr:hypothetical protein [Roseococcus suduntuyensis]
MRERFFTPRVRVKNLDELNAWLLDQCVAYARAHRDPELRDQTIWSVFEAERPSLVPYGGRFDGFHTMSASVSKTCLVRFDNNRYSVSAHAVGRSVEIRAYADRIELRRAVRPVGEHPRCFGRDQTVFDPWHVVRGARLRRDVPVLARKPGALRNGAPFKDWLLRAGLERIRRKLAGTADDDRQMVSILAAVPSDGLAAVEAACLGALREGVQPSPTAPGRATRGRDLRSKGGPFCAPMGGPSCAPIDTGRRGCRARSPPRSAAIRISCRPSCRNRRAAAEGCRSAGSD